MSNITVGGQAYDVQKMVPREQLQVFRRIAPLLSTVMRAVIVMIDEEGDPKAALAEAMQSIGPLTDSLAAMTNEQFDYVLDACLLKVLRLDADDKWHPIYASNGRGGVLRMYQDIDAAAELRLVAEVLKLNLQGFFALLPGVSAPPSSASSAAQGVALTR